MYTGIEKERLVVLDERISTLEDMIHVHSNQLNRELTPLLNERDNIPWDAEWRNFDRIKLAAVQAREEYRVRAKVTVTLDDIEHTLHTQSLTDKLKKWAMPVVFFLWQMLNINCLIWAVCMVFSQMHGAWRWTIIVEITCFWLSAILSAARFRQEFIA